MDTIKSGVHGFIDVFAGVIERIHLAGRALSDAVRDSRSLLASLATPDERFAEMVESIRKFAEMGMEGFVGRVDELIGRARDQIFGIETPVAAFERRGGPQLAERGSQDAFRALDRSADRQRDQLTRIRDIQEKQVQIQNRMERRLAAIERNTDGQEEVTEIV